MLTETGLGTIIGAAGTAITITNSVIIWIVSGLRKEFKDFDKECRSRHEVIPLQTDLDKLERDCMARHERDKHEIEHNADLFLAASKANSHEIEGLKLKLATANGAQHK